MPSSAHKSAKRTITDMDLTQGLPLPKTPAGTRRQQQARAARAEAKHIKLVRAQCDRRDGPCRLGLLAPDWAESHDERVFHVCDGPSEWAHFAQHRRAKTVNQAPERRHTTAGSLKLCRAAHQAYDGGRLLITALTRKGCNGRLKFRWASK